MVARVSEGNGRKFSNGSVDGMIKVDRMIKIE